jgi:hypothetical protein
VTGAKVVRATTGERDPELVLMMELPAVLGECGERAGFARGRFQNAWPFPNV